MKRYAYFMIAVWTIIGLSSCKKNKDKLDADKAVHITVLYTNDEHGWIEPNETYGGASGLTYKWKVQDGYDGSDNYLILSGGDMWSGPAISTGFQGKSVVEAMNAMEYDAAAIGNHEFDFKINILEQRLAEQTFPLLAANIVEKNSNAIPSFATPYIIKEVEGVKVGIIGLASQTTPYTTFPTHVENYSFTGYAAAVEKSAKQAKAEGADVLMLIGHICSVEMNDLVSVAQANGICLIGGGHCHQEYIAEKNGVVLVQASSGMRAYAKVEFDYFPKDASIQNFAYRIVPNTAGEKDLEVQQVVDKWVTEVNNEFSEQIGYTDVAIAQGAPEMQNMVCDSWLHSFANADVALTNGGGIRQSIPAGEVTLNTIVGLLPFENTILELELSGAELKELALESDICMGGMTTIGGFRLASGEEITDAAEYKVLTTDYLYARTDYNFAAYDPEPTYTYTHYRQPLIDWMKTISTTSADPITNYLDYTARR